MLADPNRKAFKLSGGLGLVGVLEMAIRDLRHELDGARARELELLRQLAEKDAQIRIVLEEKFYRPEAPKPNATIQSTRPVRPEDVTDVTQFDRDSDAKQIKAQEEEFRRASAALDRELEELAEEQAAAHRGEPVEPVEPIKMLERVAEHLYPSQAEKIQPLPAKREERAAKATVEVRDL